MKKIFVDVETTGLNPKTNGVIQISGFIVPGDGRVVPFDFHCKPLTIDHVEDKALEVNNTTHTQISSFPIAMETKHRFTELLDNYINKYNKRDKFIFIGYNAPFDESFIRVWFEKLDDPYFGSYFFYPSIDVMNLAVFKLLERRDELENFKLSTVCTFFGLEVIEEQLHDSLYDAELTMKLFNLLTKGEVLCP